MSYGSVVHAEVEARKAREQQKRKAEKDRAALSRAASEWVAEQLPDLAGDGFAVYAALVLKAEGGPVTPAAVRARRARHRLPDGRLLGGGRWRDETRKAA